MRLRKDTKCKSHSRIAKVGLSVLLTEDTPYFKPHCKELRNYVQVLSLISLEILALQCLENIIVGLGLSLTSFQ